MITFWDTSAVINGFLNPKVLDRLNDGQHLSRPHVLAEFFSIMTGRGIRWIDDQGQLCLTVLTADDAAVWLRNFIGKLQWIDLNEKEIIQAFSQAKAFGVQGGCVYVFLAKRSRTPFALALSANL